MTKPKSQEKHFAVIVAGGSGTRMGGGIPKQFRSLCGRPVLWWSIKAFHSENPDTQIVLVLPENFISLWTDFFSTLPEKDRFDHYVTTGGENRSESVKKGLALIDDDNSLVAIHDGARPLVTTALISAGWNLAKEKGAAIPVVPVTDSLRKITGNENKSVDRNEYVAVQTPQVFLTSLIKEAYRQAGDYIFNDEAAVVENAGHAISLFDGNIENIKITNPKDLAIASLLMGNGV